MEIEFVHEPKSLVGNEFHAKWGTCRSVNCPVCSSQPLYHYWEGATLHVWVDRIAIRMFKELDASIASRSVLHSDYTLQELWDYNRGKEKVLELVENLMRKEEQNV